MKRKIIKYIAKFVHQLADKKYIHTVHFSLKGYWHQNQWQKRDEYIRLGYTQSSHTWNEFDEWSFYDYSKKIQSYKYFRAVIQFLNNW